MFSLLELHREFMVDGQKDYLLIVYPHRQHGHLFFRVGDFDLVELIGGKLHDHSRVRCFFVELGLLRCQLDSCLLVEFISKGMHFNFEFVEHFGVRHGYVEIDLREGRVFI